MMNCFGKHHGKRFRNIFYEDNATPLPWGVLSSIFVLLLFNAMNFTMVFAFLPKLIRSYGTSEVNIGYQVGEVASAMFIGRAIFSFIWGYIADIKGRKITVIISATFMASVTLAFGFSKDFEWTLYTRFLQGCCMGLVAISKAILGSHCDNSNMPLAMSILVASFSTGLIIGPSIGGFLVFPGEKYPNVFSKDSLFNRYNILLPTVIVVVGFAVSIIMIMCLIENDHKVKNDTIENSFLDINEDSDRDVNEDSDRDINENCFLDINEDSDRDVNEDSDRVTLLNNEKTETKKSNTIKKTLKLKYVFMKSNKFCILASALNGFYSIIQIGFEEMFPLFAATSTNKNGLGFDTSHIGVSLLAVAMFTLVLQLCFLPQLLKYFGCRKLFFHGNIIQFLFFPLIPCTHYFRNRFVFWPTLIFILLILRMSVCSALLSLNMLINNSVEDKFLGTANGLGLTFSTIGRAISPLTLGSLFAWSISNTTDDNHRKTVRFPFQFIVFFLLSVLSLIAALFIRCFPASMDKKRKIR